MNQPTLANDPQSQRTQAALAVLAQSAEAMSKGMIAVAEISAMGSVVLNSYAIPANTSTTTAIQWQFPSDGFVVAVRASTQDGLAASMAACALRVQADGYIDLFTSSNGQGGGFIPFSLISGANAQNGRFAIRKEFQQSTYWAIYLRNPTAGVLTVDVTMDIVKTRNPIL